MARRIHAGQMAMMGAFAGFLDFLIKDQTRLRAEEAELRKMERIRSIEEEVWARRNAVENAQQTKRDELQFRRERLLAQEQRTWQTGEKAADRQHDFATIDAQTGARLTEIGAQGAESRATDKAQSEHGRLDHVYKETFDRAFDRIMPKNDGKGVLGSDGKTYPYGTPLPAGVKPAGGYGISWAPSASKGGPAGATARRRPQVGEVGSAAAPAPAVPAGYALIGKTPDGRPVYRGPDGKTYVDE